MSAIIVGCVTAGVVLIVIILFILGMCFIWRRPGIVAAFFAPAMTAGRAVSRRFSRSPDYYLDSEDTFTDGQKKSKKKAPMPLPSYTNPTQKKQRIKIDRTNQDSNMNPVYKPQLQASDGNPSGGNMDAICENQLNLQTSGEMKTKTKQKRHRTTANNDDPLNIMQTEQKLKSKSKEKKNDKTKATKEVLYETPKPTADARYANHNAVTREPVHGKGVVFDDHQIYENVV